jgi:outer membrane protein OmpA-like peptidoglycan-associated protein
MDAGKYRRNVRVIAAATLAAVSICAATTMQAALNARDLTLNQRARDQAFRTLKANATEYSFEYVVIQVPPGSVPGVDVPVPVSHIRFKSTIFFGFNKSEIEPSAEKAILDLAQGQSSGTNRPARCLSSATPIPLGPTSTTARFRSHVLLPWQASSKRAA